MHHFGSHHANHPFAKRIRKTIFMFVRMWINESIKKAIKVTLQVHCYNVAACQVLLLSCNANVLTLFVIHMHIKDMIFCTLSISGLFSVLLFGTILRVKTGLESFVSYQSHTSQFACIILIFMWYLNEKEQYLYYTIDCMNQHHLPACIFGDNKFVRVFLLWQT
jgi:hypothetical protein